MEDWFLTSWADLGLVALSTFAIYVALIALTRISGLRSFSKMSSFDFATTVAIGSIIATSIVSKNPPLLQGAVALISIYVLQFIAAKLRERTEWAENVFNNDPLLLMLGNRMLEENMKHARVSEGDIRAKLREANVLNYDQVCAVVMESTGDVSVLHRSDDDMELDESLLKGVRGLDAIEDADPICSAVDKAQLEFT